MMRKTLLAATRFGPSLGRPWRFREETCTGSGTR